MHAGTRLSAEQQTPFHQRRSCLNSLTMAPTENSEMTHLSGSVWLIEIRQLQIEG